MAGWVVVDWYALRIGAIADARVPHDAFQWLLEHEPAARVGASMLVYHFERAPRLSPAMERKRKAWLASASAHDLRDPDRVAAEDWGPRRDEI